MSLNVFHVMYESVVQTEMQLCHEGFRLIRNLSHIVSYCTYSEWESLLSLVLVLVIMLASISIF